MIYELLLALDLSTTRITTYDFQCRDAQGVKISDHTRFDTALIACLNAPNGSQIDGGTYRINRSAPPPSPPVTGSAVISWTRPPMNTDGTLLTDIAGYRIYYGTNAGSLDQMQSVAAGLTVSTVPNLSPGTWYFSMTTRNVAGVESARTNLASKVVN